MLNSSIVDAALRRVASVGRSATLGLVLVSPLLVASSVARAQPEDERSQRSERDSDEDGLPDRLEEATGTDPLQADTDADGVDDGDEDRNRDGHVGHGESDPRRAGLFPGHAPHIPEPLVFDLVRGLGAERGELEVNTLALVDARRGTVHWAPEVEWAFAKGHAIELELPLVDRQLEAVKVALQGTLPSRRPTFTHGWQVFAEVGLHSDQMHAAQSDAVLVYILGQRLTPKWSYLAMFGADTHVSDKRVSGVTAIGNLSVFVDVREWQTWGLETNTTVMDSGEWAIRALPQLHLQVTERFRLQLSVGAEIRREEVTPWVAVRTILE